MNARFYDANTQRFLSQDTYKGNAWEPMSQNLYSYVGNNPVNYIDPTGHFGIDISFGEAFKQALNDAISEVRELWDYLSEVEYDNIVSNFTDEELEIMRNNVSVSIEDFDGNVIITAQYTTPEMEELLSNHTMETLDIFFIMAHMGAEKAVVEHGEELPEGGFPLSEITMMYEIAYHYAGENYLDFFGLVNNIMYDSFETANVSERDARFWESEYGKWMDYFVFCYWNPTNWG